MAFNSRVICCSYIVPAPVVCRVQSLGMPDPFSVQPETRVQRIRWSVLARHNCSIWGVLQTWLLVEKRKTHSIVLGHSLASQAVHARCREVWHPKSLLLLVEIVLVLKLLHALLMLLVVLPLGSQVSYKVCQVCAAEQLRIHKCHAGEQDQQVGHVMKQIKHKTYYAQDY